jgi:hypothetical protein
MTRPDQSTRQLSENRILADSTRLPGLDRQKRITMMTAF